MTADKFKEDIKSLRDKELLDARENSTLKSPPIMIELAHLPERVHVSQLMLAALKSPHRTAGTVVGILAIDPSSSSSRPREERPRGWSIVHSHYMSFLRNLSCTPDKFTSRIQILP